MICIKRYYYAETEKSSTLDVKHRTGLNLGYMPLIWNNAGLYGIISSNKVENMIHLIVDQSKLPIVEGVNLSGVLFWDEVVVLDSKVAKLLLGQK